MNVNIDFDAIKDTVVDLAQSGVAQGKKVVTAAKLKADNMAQRDAIRKAYLAIGKQYFASHRGEPEEELAQLFAAVEYAMAAIEANNAELAAMKAEPDVSVDLDVEMQAGEVPDDLETLIEQEMESADFADAEEAAEPVEVSDEEAPVEDVPAEEIPVEEVTAEDVPAAEPAVEDVTEDDFADEDIQD